MKQCTNLELSSFTGLGDILERMPKILGVTWPRPRSFSEILYSRSVGRAKSKPCTKFEVSRFIGFRDIVEGVPNFLGSRDLGHAPFSNKVHHSCGKGQHEVVYQIWGIQLYWFSRYSGVCAKYSRGHVTLATPFSEIVYYKLVEGPNRSCVPT